MITLYTLNFEFPSKLIANFERQDIKCNKGHSLGCKTYIQKIYDAKCNMVYNLGW